jgi:HPt (histidine-containing phosphotransfer) domain-containing protein
MSDEIHGSDGSDVDDETLRSAVDVGRFFKLAGKDPEGLVRMMDEYVAETRRMAGMWPHLLQAGEAGEVSEQLHMCKGGAAIFGFSRIIKMIGSLEKDPALASGGYDAQAFERELALVERAIAALAGGRLT